MAKAKSKKKHKPLTFEQASQRLPAAASKREKLLADYQQVHAQFHAAHDALSYSFKAMSAVSSEIGRHQQVIDRLRSIVDLGPGAIEPEEREVDAPLMTDAEFRHQKELDPEAVNVGKSKVLFSMDQFIGGFSRYPNRKPYQEMTAARFLSLHERSQLGGAKATDYSMPYVDRSGPCEDGVLVAGEDARRAWNAMLEDKAVGSDRVKLLERVIVGRVSAREMAAEHTGKSADTVHGKAITAVTGQVWEAIEAIAVHLGFAGKGNKSVA